MDCLPVSSREKAEQFYFHSGNFSCDNLGENHRAGNIAEIDAAFPCGSMDLIVCCVPFNFYTAPFDLLDQIMNLRSENGYILILWENAYNIKMLKYMFGMEQDLKFETFLPIPVLTFSQFLLDRYQNVERTVYSDNQLANIEDQDLIRLLSSIFDKSPNLMQTLNTNRFYIMLSGQ